MKMESGTHSEVAPSPSHLTPQSKLNIIKNQQDGDNSSQSNTRKQTSSRGLSVNEILVPDATPLMQHKDILDMLPNDAVYNGQFGLLPRLGHQRRLSNNGAPPAAPIEIGSGLNHYDPSSKHAIKSALLNHPPVYEPLDMTQVEKLLARVGLNQ